MEKWHQGILVPYLVFLLQLSRKTRQRILCHTALENYVYQKVVLVLYTNYFDYYTLPSAEKRVFYKYRTE